MTKIISKRQVFTGKVTTISEVDLDFENGSKRTFEVVGFNVVTGVSALPIKDEKLLLIKHYQAGIHADGYSLPTGGLGAHEDPETRMQLELQEEIGYKAGKMTLLARLDILPGYISTKSGYLYLAEKLKPSAKVGDEPYTIDLHRLTLTQALDMVVSGKIRDTRTMLAILYYARLKGV
jgi:8-oxo-dGTP pyrophosphatase MutT (NUDIX family)